MEEEREEVMWRTNEEGKKKEKEIKNVSLPSKIFLPQLIIPANWLAAIANSYPT